MSNMHSRAAQAQASPLKGYPFPATYILPSSPIHHLVILRSDEDFVWSPFSIFWAGLVPISTWGACRHWIGGSEKLKTVCRLLIILTEFYVVLNLIFYFYFDIYRFKIDIIGNIAYFPDLLLMYDTLMDNSKFLAIPNSIFGALYPLCTQNKHLASHLCGAKIPKWVVGCISKLYFVI